MRFVLMCVYIMRPTCMVYIYSVHSQSLFLRYTLLYTSYTLPYTHSTYTTCIDRFLQGRSRRQQCYSNRIRFSHFHRCDIYSYIICSYILYTTTYTTLYCILYYTVLYCILHVILYCILYTKLYSYASGNRHQSQNYHQNNF